MIFACFKSSHYLTSTARNKIQVQEFKICLRIDQKSRLTVGAAIESPFFSTVRNIDEEPNTETIFDFNFEHQASSIEEMKIMLQDEVDQFRAQVRKTSIKI